MSPVKQINGVKLPMYFWYFKSLIKNINISLDNENIIILINNCIADNSVIISLRFYHSWFYFWVKVCQTKTWRPENWQKQMLVKLRPYQTHVSGVQFQCLVRVLIQRSWGIIWLLCAAHQPGSSKFWSSQHDLGIVVHGEFWQRKLQPIRNLVFKWGVDDTFSRWSSN